MAYLSPYLDPQVPSLISTPTLPFLENAYNLLSTPLTLPRHWPCDPAYTAGGADFYDDDFQSNALHAPSTTHSGLSGLGIRYSDFPPELTVNSSRPDNYPTNLTHAVESRSDLLRTANLELADSSLTSPQLQPSWSPKSLNQDTGETSPDFIPSDGQGNGCESPSRNDLGMNLALSFEQLSSVSGLSIEELAARLSASAEAALERLTYAGNIVHDPVSSNGTFEGIEAASGDLAAAAGRFYWPPLSNTTPEMVVPMADANMRSRGVPWTDQCMGINPADIMPSQSLPQTVEAMCVFLVHSDTCSVPETCSPCEEDRQQSPIPKFADTTALYDLPQDRLLDPADLEYSFIDGSVLQNIDRQSEDEVSVYQSPSSSEYSPSLDYVVEPICSPKIGKRKVRRNTAQADTGITSPKRQVNLRKQEDFPPVVLGTPVLEAHRGVELEVLRTKAERYRLRNQGRDYDKRWLISFAGKLSARGELVEEFRCYIVGCRQTNKRRDHILIHVGAHLDQRPFRCPLCPSRFLRKNECKRHELSHTGIRPYSCHLCPPPATTFVRQDLLKRHMKRTHRASSGNSDKENMDVCRPKKRARL